MSSLFQGLSVNGKLKTTAGPAVTYFRGLGIAADGGIAIGVGPAVAWTAGIPTNAQGQMVVATNTAGVLDLPDLLAQTPNSYGPGGLPLKDGAVVLDTADAVAWANGVGYTAGGGISATAVFGPDVWNPSRLFAAGEQGVWLDPSDFSTMWQDSAGTIPVTAVEQPVGRILDKSGRGNTFIQATASKRPTLRARHNLLTMSEDFTDGVWFKGAGGAGSVPAVTANAGLAPNGTMTADRMQLTLGGGTSSGDYSFLYYINADAPHPGFTSVYMRSYDGVSTYRLFYGMGANAVAITVTPEWQRFGLPTLSTANNSKVQFGLSGGGLASSNVADILAWGAQHNYGNFATQYQRIGAATDYDTGPQFPQYLDFDGVDDSMISAATVDFTGTDNMTGFAGHLKRNDAAPGVIYELSPDYGLPGSFSLWAPFGDPGYRATSSGTGGVSDPTATKPAPVVGVLTAVGEISDSYCTLSLDGITLAANVNSQGGGSYRNDTLFFGARNNVGFPFNGTVYSIIVRGKLSNATEIVNTEAWIKSRMVPAAWDPSFMFANGEKGAWYDPSDLSTVFQDAAGTIPVTATGQPVGKILDKSGNGNHLVQTVAAARPLLNMDNGATYLFFYGDDKFLVSAANFDLSTTDKLTVGYGYKSETSTLRMIAEHSVQSEFTNGTFLVFHDSNWHYVGFHGTTALWQVYRPSAEVPPALGQIFVDRANMAASPVGSMRVNGVDKPLILAAGPTGVGNFGSYPLFVGARAGTELLAYGRMFSLVIRGKLSSDLECADLERYIQPKMGIWKP